jgi:hypothetical protein
MFKEYPGEANPRGLHWRELKQPEMPMEGSIVENPNPQFGTLFEYVAPDGTVLRRERTRAELEKNIARDAKEAGYKPLEEQLKYEGEQMGHCVGGYCPDVVEGRSKIYSLRDAKGQPHVTIETQPYGSHNEDIMFAELTGKLGRQPNPSELAEAMSVAPMRIVQIKGKGNKAPVEEYLPMVQDFVKSGKWSDVGDLQNTGLIRHPETGEFVTGASRRQELLDELAREALPPEPGFAAGGLVNDSISGYNADRVDSIVDQLRNELFTT